MSTEVSFVRLGMLRAGYLLLVIGLGLTLWPSILNPAKSWELMHGVVVSMLAAMSLLAVLGLRYPLQMLPLLFFELAWKAIWLVRVALPMGLAHRLDANTAETMNDCFVAVVFLVVIPWDWVVRQYVLKPGDPWLKRPAPRVAE